VNAQPTKQENRKMNQLKLGASSRLEIQKNFDENFEIKTARILETVAFLWQLPFKQERLSSQ
jgi:hypothetical protein